MTESNSKNTKKQYYLENKEAILEKKKKYCESLTEEQKKHQKEVQQEYYAFNLETISQKQKERYEEKYKEIVVCNCGLEIHKPYLERHKQTQKHFKNLKWLKSAYKPTKVT